MMSAEKIIQSMVNFCSDLHIQSMFREVLICSAVGDDEIVTGSADLHLAK